MKEITEKTLLPISLVVIVGGFIYWAAQLDAEVRAHSGRIDKLQVHSEAYMNSMGEIKSDIAVIKQILQEKKK